MPLDSERRIRLEALADRIRKTNVPNVLFGLTREDVKDVVGGLIDLSESSGGGGGGGAPTDAVYIVAATNAGLSAERVVTDTLTITWDLSTPGQAKGVIPDNAITLAKLADMATASFLGRNTAGSGDPEVLSIAVAKAMLNLTGTNSGDQTISLTGDVTGSGTGSFAATIANDAVTLAKLANIATDVLIGRDTTGTGDPETITVGGGLEFTGSGGIRRSALTGDVTAAAGSGSTTIANSAVTLAKLADLATARFLGRTTAGTGVPEALTGTQATALLDVFTSGAKGLAPASGGGTANFLRADGTWAAPAGGGGGLTLVTEQTSPGRVTVNGRLRSGNDQATTSAFETGGGVAGLINYNMPTSASVAFLGSYNLVRVSTTAAARTAITEALRARIETSGANAISGALKGIEFEVELGHAGDTDDVFGAYFSVLNSSSPNTGELRGLVLEVSNAGSGTIERIVASESRLISSAGTVTEAIGHRVLAPSGPGTFSAFRALVLGCPDTGGSPNSFFSTFTPGDQTATFHYVFPIDTPAPGEVLSPASVTGSGPYTIVLEWAAGGGGGGGAPTDATYIVATTNGTLSAERVLTDTATVTWDAATGGQMKANVPDAAITLAKLANLATARFIGRTTAGTGVPEALTGTQATALLDAFTSGAKGLVPASGGGTTNFLRADGSFAAPTATLDIGALTTVVPVAADLCPFGDVSDSNNAKKATFQTVIDGTLFERRLARNQWWEELSQEVNGIFNGFPISGNLNARFNGSMVALAPGATNESGVIQLGTGNTNTGRAAIVTAGDAFVNGASAKSVIIGFRLPTLSTSGERYQVLVGFFDEATAVDQADGCYMLYDEGGVSAGSAASANWQSVTAANSSRTFNTTATAVATTKTSVRVDINAAANSVSFFLNGSSAATMTTTIPSGTSRTFGLGILIIKSVGTAERFCLAEFIGLDELFNTPRT